MKKILVVSEVFWPENFMVNDLVVQLKEAGYHVDILTQHPSYPFGKVFDGYENTDFYCEEWGGSKIYRYKVIEGYRDSFVKKVWNYFYFAYRGSIIAKQLPEDYDAVFVSQTGPLTVSLPAISYAKKHQCPLYIWVFDLWPDSVYAYGIKKNKILDAILNRFIYSVYNQCAKIFVSSKSFIEHVQRYVKDKPIHYMPNWLMDCVDTPTSIVYQKDVFNISFAGNISRYQNLENVIKGFALAKLDRCVLNIVGDGSSLDSLKYLVNKEGIENVRFHGRQPSTSIHQILLQSDALLISLIKDEGVQKTEPLKLQSYLRSGKPILGVIAGSVADIIQEYGLGLCSEPNDIQDIALKFKQFIDFTHENTEAVAMKASGLMKTRFDRETIFKKFLSELESQ